MALTDEQAAYLGAHQWAVLATGRKDGSPQVSMVGYTWNGSDVVVSFRRSSAKYHNVVRQPRVALLVADGRQALTVYGDAEILEDDPARVEAFAQILAGFGAPVPPLEDLARQMDTERRVVLRMHPATADLHE